MLTLLKKILRRTLQPKTSAPSCKGSSLTVAPSARVNPATLSFMENCRLTIGDQSIVEARVVFERPGGTVNIGSRTFIGGSSLLCASHINIGDDVLVSFGVTIVDHDSHSPVFSKRSQDVTMWLEGKKDWTHVKTNPITIQDKSWIGMHSIILEGTTIGTGAVVGAGSVVTRDVPPYTVVAGNPARIIKTLPDDR